MHLVERLSWAILATTVCLGLAALVAVAQQEFVACPASVVVGDNFKEAIATLTDVVKWGIGIAVGAAGLFGSQLLTIKEGPRYSPAGRTLLVSVVIGMCLAAYFGLRWRSLVAQAWFLKCPELIADTLLQRSFDYHTYFLAGGLGVLALMALLLTFSPSKG